MRQYNTWPLHGRVWQHWKGLKSDLSLRNILTFWGGRWQLQMIMRRPCQEVSTDFYLSWQAAKTTVICGHFVLCHQLEAWCCQLEQNLMTAWRLGTLGTAGKHTNTHWLAGIGGPSCVQIIRVPVCFHSYTGSQLICVCASSRFCTVYWRFAFTHTCRHQLQLCGSFGLSLSSGSGMFETRLNPAPASNINTHRI